MSERAAPGRMSVAALRTFDWRQYIIYFGFLIVFVLFAITLNERVS